MTPYEKAIDDALDMADVIVEIDNNKYPAFYGMSDARICANLLHDQSGAQMYAREYYLASQKVYVVY